MDKVLEEEHKNLKNLKKKLKEYKTRIQKSEALISKLQKKQKKQKKQDALYVPTFPNYEPTVKRTSDPLGGMERREVELPDGGLLLSLVSPKGRKVRDVYQNFKGERHRTGGPAVLDYSKDGRIINEEYWLDGIRV